MLRSRQVPQRSRRTEGELPGLGESGAHERAESLGRKGDPARSAPHGSGARCAAARNALHAQIAHSEAAPGFREGEVHVRHRGVRRHGVDQHAQRLRSVGPEGGVHIGDALAGGDRDEKPDRAGEDPAIPGVGAAVPYPVHHIRVLRHERLDQAGEVRAMELAVAVDVHEDLRIDGEARAVGREGRRAVATIHGLHLHHRVGDAVEGRRGGIRRPIVGDMEADHLRQRGDGGMTMARWRRVTESSGAGDGWRAAQQVA
ncbi:unnamed protein product [Penicillium discolor]